MPNTYHQVYIQIVFAVKYRASILNKAWRNNVFGIMGDLINRTGSKAIIVNGVEDHVHCFLGLKPSISISDLVQIVKGNSSKFINDRQYLPSHFAWQEGFGVFSYMRSDLDRMYKYIANQEAHHTMESFKEEYTRHLREFDIPYEDQYLFKDLL
jgi:putative transposase